MTLAYLLIRLHLQPEFKRFCGSTMHLLPIMLLFSLLSAAPLDIAGGVEDDNDGFHGHAENVTRLGKYFVHNQFDFSVSVEGDVGSIGHEVNIDVYDHTHDHHHHEDDTVIECKEGLSVLFKSIDSNKNGLMDPKELLSVCHQINIQITESVAVRILTLPDKTVGFNIAKFCELLKNCPITNSADIIYFLLQQYDKVTVEEQREFSPPRPQPKVTIEEQREFSPPRPQPKGCEVHVGKSTSNTISATVTEGCVCPTLLKGNWLGDGTYEFKVTQDGSSLQVQRTDSNFGWSLDLSFMCKPGKPWCKGRNYPGGRECCESEDPHGSKCTEGQGDCDSDAGCAGDLVCGKNNCRQYHSGASTKDDCCTKPETTCDASTWPDLDHGLTCGVCKALINNMDSKYITCEGYCKSIDRRCSGAWEESGDSCEIKSTESCTHKFTYTSDAICECSSTILGPAPVNLFQNGDFEKATLDPWSFNGCKGEASPPGASGEGASLHVSERRANWAAPQQILTNLTGGVAGVSYTLGYSVNPEADMEMEWKVRVKSSSETKYHRLKSSHAKAGAWKVVQDSFQFPASVKDAEEVLLYLKTTSGTAGYRLDDVWLSLEDAGDWEAEANARIEKLRKRDAKIRVKVGSGVDKTKLRLEVDQLGHSFAFGTAIECDKISACYTSGVDDKFCKFTKDNFNMLVSHYKMKWRYVQMNKGDDNYQPGDDMVAWAQDNGLRARGHALLWSKLLNNPAWVQSLYGDDMVKAIYDRVDSAMRRYDGKVEHWDVINEMVDQGPTNHTFYTDRTGDPEIRTKVFLRARSNSPATKLFVNDYGIVLDKGGRFGMYQDQIRGLLQSKAPLDGIGLQSHITRDLVDVVNIKKRVDLLWKEFGLPLWVTEFTWRPGGLSDPDHKIHATQLENYYRLMFSHEGIGGILMWHFGKKGRHEIVNPSTMEPNAAGQVYLRLYHQEWRTKEMLESSNGNFDFRGFMGTYNLKLWEDKKLLKDWNMELEKDTMSCVTVGKGVKCS